MPTAEEIAATEAAAKAAADEAAKAEADEAKELGEKGVAALKEERAARKAAEKVAKDAADKLAAAQKLIDDANAAKAAADERDALAKGEFEKLATDRAEAIKQRDATLKELQAERDALKERMDARDAEDIATVAAWIKDHKGAVDDFLDFYPGADAPASAQLAWFNATRPKVEKRAADPARGNGRSPEYANGRDSKADEAAMAAGARQNRNRF